MEKYGDSENLSKVIEVDDRTMAQSDSENDNDDTGVGRTYECNYCKRGFTNAQALGGHMNIHRKDKAKAKQQPSFSPSSPISYKPDEAISNYSSNLASQRNYQLYYPFANPIASQSSFYGANDFSIGRTTRFFGMYDQDHLGVDLSLGISSSRVSLHHQGDQENMKQDAIDLELRLGYDP